MDKSENHGQGTQVLGLTTLRSPHDAWHKLSEGGLAGKVIRRIATWENLEGWTRPRKQPNR